MGGRGSGGGKGGGKASAGNVGGSSVSDELLQGNISLAQNRIYKYEDDAYEYNKIAKSEMAMANQFRKRGNIKKAEEYENYSKVSKTKAEKAKKEANKYKKELKNLTKEKTKNIPSSYKYDGDNGYSRTVYKSPQKALEHWKSRKESTVSTAYADSPTIVKSPKGGYSVVPHSLVKRNNLTVINPYDIKPTY